MIAKVGNKQIESDVIVAIKEAKKPVTVRYIRLKLGVSWITARAILYRMANEGKIKCQETTQTPFFWVGKKGKVGKNDTKRT